MDNIFDDLHLDNTNDSTDHHTFDDDGSFTNQLFDDLRIDKEDESRDDKSHDDKSDDEVHIDNSSETIEDKSEDVNSNNDVNNTKINTESSKSTESKSLTINDVDEFFKRNKEIEEQKAELLRYKEEEAKRKEESKKVEDKMPDPLYNPEEYRKWVYEQNNAIESRYEARLVELQNKMIVDNITNNLNRTYGSTVEKFGEANVKEAEAWAANIIKNSPKEAMAYLNSNPSWDYIVTEYNKAKEREEYERNPEEYINKKINERTTDTTSNVKPDVKEKKVVKSINSIPSKSDPKPEVPHFFEGLF